MLVLNFQSSKDEAKKETQAGAKTTTNAPQSKTTKDETKKGNQAASKPVTAPIAKGRYNAGNNFADAESFNSYEQGTDFWERSTTQDRRVFVNLFDKESIVNLVGKIDKKIFLPIRNVKGAIVGYYKKDYGYYIKEVKEKESYIQDCKQKGIKPDYARLVDTEPLVIGTPHETTGLFDVALFLIPETPAEVAIGVLRQYLLSR